MHILVIEDERKVAALLRQALEEDGHAVDTIHDGLDGLRAIRAISYDLLILDDMLPGLSGRELCRTLRAENSPLPVLMVTARAALAERVDGLDSGADDYLTKPFSIEELRARARALLRRRDKQAATVISVEDLVLDPSRRTVLRGNRVIELSAREFALLDYLMRNARRPVTRTAIAEQVWGFHFDYGSNVIDVYIGYLRTKVERGSEKKLIHTVRNVGYQLG